MNLEKTALDSLAANESSLVELASAIWERPELGLQETFAAGLIARRLEQEVFSVEMGAGEMETAFVASWGQGRPDRSFPATREPSAPAWEPPAGGLRDLLLPIRHGHVTV